MAAKFTAGDSMRSTTHITAAKKPREAPTSSMKLRSGNTMSGMGGRINTTARATEGMKKSLRGEGGTKIMKNGSMALPSSPGSKANGKKLNNPGMKARGTMSSSYKAKSTGSAGKVESMRGRTMTKAEGRRSKSVMY